jgi:predicted DNA-binding transcriptional regulator YafY
VAEPAEAIRRLITPAGTSDTGYPDPETTAALVQACVNRHRLRIAYRRGDDDLTMEIDPWAVSIRHGRWYLLCWSHSKNARRVLRVDRVTTIDVLPDTFTPPDDLDPVRAIQEHFSEGWKYQVEVVIDAPIADVDRWIARNLGRLEEVDADHTRLIGSTDEPEWYAYRIASIPARFRVVGPAELRDAVRLLGQNLLRAGRGQDS